MRRIGAVLAAGILTISLGGAVAGATSRSSFNGDFDVWADGTLAGHITAQTSGLAAGPGTYKFISYLGFNNGSAIIGEATFTAYPDEGYNEVQFTALEVGYPAPGYGMFTGRFVDMLDPAETDFVQFWSAEINADPATGGTVDPTFQGTFEVGEGAFVLRVRGS
jgi:hypothetical protein